MTKEETISNLKAYLDGDTAIGNIIPLRSVLEAAIKYLEPSIPSTKENIIIPRWFLETIEDTLRIQNNINLDKKTGETCQDRNIKQSLNGVRKLLRGEELTGGERFEKLQPSLRH